MITFQIQVSFSNRSVELLRIKFLLMHLNMFPENIQNINKPGKNGRFLLEFKLIKRIYLLIFA